ncbi:MAG TPA: ABC transporter permease [Vicinamibacterales bacterium]|nr:ABC transporter permease [Vicinamibacterales bacterium]
MPIFHDVKIAVRRLAARPAYTLLILGTLALGIGAATAVFSVVDQTILRPAPFPHADRLVDVMHIHSVRKSGGSSMTPQKTLGWQGQPSLFERLELYAHQQVDVTGGAEPERLTGLNVSLGLFEMLAARPQVGRSFSVGDGAPGSERVVLISDAVWRRRFGGDADVLGQRIKFNDTDYTIIGVMPRRFRLLSQEESFWLPVDLQAFASDSRFQGYGIGRLAPGVRQADAQKLADALTERMDKEVPIPMTWGLGIEPKHIARVDATTRTALFVLLGAVGFVLLITCANVANLFLSQAPTRQREMAVRSALGASRMALVRSVLVESLLLAIVGGTLGIVLANWGVGAILAAAPTRMVSLSTTPIEVDGRVLAVAAILTILTGFFFGLLPAFRGSRPNLETTLRTAGGSGGRGSYGRIPGSLVVIEVAFAVILLVGAALMTRTLANLNAIDSGFEADGLVTMHIALPSDRYPNMAAYVTFFDALSEKLRAVPGIRGAAVSQGAPPSIGGISFGRPEIEGHGTPDTKTVVIPNGMVAATYFETLGIPLIAGRNFQPGEPEGGVMISKAFADKYWPNENAVGRRFRMSAASSWYTVVGVVGSVQTSAGGDNRSTIQFYHPYIARPPKPAAPGSAPAAAAAVAAQANPSAAPRRSYGYAQLIVRADIPARAIPIIKQQIWSIDPNQPVEKVTLVADSYAEMFAKQRFVLMLMGAFALVALVLTAAGIFGVLSQAVAQRTREIGIRMALGARPADVMKLVVSRGMVLAGVGAAVGIGAALALVKTLRTLLYGVEPTDPASFAIVTVLLLAVALIACWLPTRAAMRVQPAVALRTE